MMSEKGYQFAEVTHEIKELPGGPKLVHLTFNIKEGPKVKISDIEFNGNKAVERRRADQADEGEQAAALAVLHHRARHLPGSRSSRKTPTRIQEHYRNKGYISARIGTPEVKMLEDSKDGKTRYIELKIPVTEGDRYRVGSSASTATRSSRPRPCGRCSS